jgi:hypothetical protein
LLKPSKKILRQTLMTKNLTLRFTPSWPVTYAPEAKSWSTDTS